MAYPPATLIIASKSSAQDTNDDISVLSSNNINDTNYREVISIITKNTMSRKGLKLVNYLLRKIQKSNKTNNKKQFKSQYGTTPLVCYTV